ncbi:MAG: metal-sulfur cluster assembly factor [Armatimonadota bacterium]
MSMVGGGASPVGAPAVGAAAVGATTREIQAALREVLDPEYPISIVDLGLIRGVEVAGATVKVRMTYTSMGCPCMDMIQDDVRERLLRLPGVDRVEIEVVWEPWSRRHVSKDGLQQLQRFGVV